MAQLLIRRLENFVALSDVERQALVALPTRSKRIRSRRDFPVDPVAQGAVHLIEDGFACRYKNLPDGRRQILSYLVPGDVADLRLFILGRAESSASTLSCVSVSMVARDDFLAVSEKFPRITRALWSATLVEEAITQEWLVNVGQRSALERMAHLFCELYWRLQAVDRVEASSFEMPITQTELADTLGLSSVHINRTLQEMRKRELISFQDKVMRIHDFESLSEIAMFSPSYLHMREAEKPGHSQKAVESAS